MSTNNRKNRPKATSTTPSAGAAPRSLQEIYEAKKRRGSPSRHHNGSKYWILAVAILVLGIGAYAAFRLRQSPDRKAETATGALPSPTSTTPALPAPGTKPSLANFKPSVPVPTTPPTGPRIQLASTVYDFGRAVGDDFVDCFFYYTNTGIAVLELSEVSPGCGCMTVRDWTKQLQPGQAGSITVRYDSHHYTGPFAKSVFVTCNDPEFAKPMLEVKGYVFRPVELSPMNAAVMLTSETPSNSASVKITSHLDAPLTLSPPVSSSPVFAAELRTNVPGKEYQLIVSTSLQQAGGFASGNITMKTSATNPPVVIVNAVANVLPLVGAIPNTIRLGPPPYTNAVAYDMWIRNNSTNALVLSDPKVNAPGVEVKIKEEQPGTQFGVTITFPPGFEVKPGESPELTVQCNHPTFPVLKVPVLQQARPPTASAAPLPR